MLPRMQSAAVIQSQAGQGVAARLLKGSEQSALGTWHAMVCCLVYKLARRQFCGFSWILVHLRDETMPETMPQWFPWPPSAQRMTNGDSSLGQFLVSGLLLDKA